VVPVQHTVINSLKSITTMDFIKIHNFYILTHTYAVYLTPIYLITITT